ncbi:MAG: glycosyltransferase [Chitinivibrionales bacterium]|nr:glycosyltransferase [Chitinivibrionales bacterium]
MSLSDFISVIVASHRPEYIAGCVESLRIARKACPHSEIIVVADYQIQAWAGRFPDAFWVYHNHRGIPHKRNAGVARAQGNYIAFVDDDCRPAEHWLIHALRYFGRHPDCAGVEGKTSIENTACGSPMYTQFKRLEKRGYRTNNIVYRKQVFYEAGGFDERFVYQREDIDLAFRILDLGYRIDYCEHMHIEHAFRADDSWDLLKNCWNRRFDPLLYQKHPRRSRDHFRSPWTPSLLTLGLGDLAAISLCLLRGKSTAATGCLLNGLVHIVVSQRHSRRMSAGSRMLSLLEFGLAPVVLALALAHGSVRFRKLLLI